MSFKGYVAKTLAGITLGGAVWGGGAAIPSQDSDILSNAQSGLGTVRETWKEWKSATFKAPVLLAVLGGTAEEIATPLIYSGAYAGGMIVGAGKELCGYVDGRLSDASRPDSLPGKYAALKSGNG